MSFNIIYHFVRDQKKSQRKNPRENLSCLKHDQNDQDRKYFAGPKQL
jgi:hypothetical protein